MSYGRNPHNIYSDGEVLHLDHYSVPEILVNAFLYKILGAASRQELMERLKKGKEEWMRPLRLEAGLASARSWEGVGPESVRVVECDPGDTEVDEARASVALWEDALLKGLMGEPVQE